mgnify:CR=1 FL=1
MGDQHTYLSKRGMAWLYSRGFRWCAVEVPMNWNLIIDGQNPSFQEIADAMGCGIINLEARSCVLEIKISRADFLSDYKKPHRWVDNPFITERYYLTPAGMLKPDELPPRWGLLEYYSDQDKIYVAKRAKRRRVAYLEKKIHFHANTPPWTLPLKPAIVGGVKMWATAWGCVAERFANDYRFKYIGLRPKNRGNRNEYTVDN